jgi:hypothetical protein
MSRTIILMLLLLISSLSKSQQGDSLMQLSGIVYDEFFTPVPYTHVIALSYGTGDVTDSMGIFELKALPADTLLILNIAYRDTLVALPDRKEFLIIHLQRKKYDLEEARIFSWGNSYADFLDAMAGMPVVESIGEELGLPKQDPDYVPFDKDEKQLKSAKFLIHSPVSYFYYNFSRREKSSRKAYWLERNKEEIELFNRLLSPLSVSDMTGLEGERLEDFMIFLNSNIKCDYRCSEMEILTELHYLWKIYEQKKY